MAKIISIKPIGLMPVFDIVGSTQHNFLTAGGTVLHNCDGIRYLCMYRKMNPQHEVVMDNFDDDGLEDYDDFMTGGMATASYIGYS